MYFLCAMEDLLWVNNKAFRRQQNVTKDCFHEAFQPIGYITKVTQASSLVTVNCSSPHSSGERNMRVKCGFYQ